MSVNSKMTAIADAIRSLLGITGTLGLDAMASKLSGIVKRTASDLSASGKTVTVPAGYYPSQVTKDVGTATQATPSISVSSAGLITASATQTAGYVSAGTKSATKQLTVQAAKTVTPGTADQTAVASGVYATGAVTVKGDANLLPENIAEGVSIFGVAGTHTGGAAEITFTIAGTTYTAQEGMTWGQWVYSDYNTGGFYVSGDYILTSDDKIVRATGGYAVTSTSVITSGYAYFTCCFMPGTQITVSLDGETKAIEEIEAGDAVVSYKPDTGENYLALVTNLVVNTLSVAMAHVEFANGTELDMTTYHPLYTKDGWHSLTMPEYGELVVGDEVKTVDGWSEITKIVRYYLAEATTTYSLAVADFGEDPDDDTNDNFYANGILAHNASNVGGCSG